MPLTLPTPQRATLPESPQLSDFPEYRAARDRLHALRARRERLAEEAERLRHQPRRDASADATAALLADDPEAAGAALDGALLSLEDRRAQPGRLYAEVEALDAAIREQENRVGHEKVYASAVIVDGLRDHYRAIQQRIADAVVALLAASAQEAAFLTDLRKRGVECAALDPHPINWPAHTARGWLKQAERKHGVRVP